MFNRAIRLARLSVYPLSRSSPVCWSFYRIRMIPKTLANAVCKISSGVDYSLKYGRTEDCHQFCIGLRRPGFSTNEAWYLQHRHI